MFIETLKARDGLYAAIRRSGGCNSTGGTEGGKTALGGMRTFDAARFPAFIPFLGTTFSRFSAPSALTH